MVLDRLADIEFALSELGFAAVANPEGCALIVTPKRAAGPDPQALWRLLTAPPAVCLSEQDLASEDYLLIALEKVAGSRA